jgi:hypothetical protein
MEVDSDGQGARSTEHGRGVAAPVLDGRNDAAEAEISQ